MNKTDRPISASQINAWIECPGAWLLTYRYGYRSDGNEVMARGLRVEQEVLASVQRWQNRGETLDVWPGDETEIRMKRAVYDALREISRHDAFVWPEGNDQHRIYYRQESTPVIGYLDALTRNRIVEIKTTSRDPGDTLPPSWARQLAIYYGAWEAVPVAMRPHLTVVVGLTRKANPCLIYSTDYALMDEWMRIDGQEIAIVRPTSKFDIIDTHAQEVRAAMDAIVSLQRVETPDIVLPIDFSHYRMRGFSAEVLADLRAGTLEENSDD